MRDGVPERRARLPRQRPAARIGDRGGHHERQFGPAGLEGAPNAEQCGLGVQGVERRLDHEQVDAALDQGHGSLAVGGVEFLESDIAEAGIGHVGRNAGRPVGGTENTGHEARAVGVAVRVGHASRDAGRRQVHLVYRILQAVVGLGDPCGGEGVRFDDICASGQEGAMDRLHDIGACQRQHVPVAFQWQVVPAETFAAVVLLGETEGLLHGARGAVEQQDTVFQGLGESGIHARRSQVSMRCRVPGHRHRVRSRRHADRQGQNDTPHLHERNGSCCAER